MTSSLFISYASDDQAVALEVCALLEAQGVRCWIAPRDVAPGAKWDEAIVDAITSAGAFLLILTDAANRSPYVGNEVNHAFAAQKPIFTFRVEDVQPSKSLGFYLARHHWTDGFPPPFDAKVVQLAQAVATLVGAGTPIPIPARRRVSVAARVGLPRWRRVLPYAATAALAMALGGYAPWRLESPPAPPVTRFSIETPGAMRNNFTRNVLAVSPDGRRLAYSTEQGVFVHSLDEDEPRLLDGVTGSGFFFSPDGQWLGYWGPEEQLRKVSIAGGIPVTLSEARGGVSGASWGSDNTIVFARGGSIWRVAGDGGTPEEIVTLEPGQLASGPQVLPDGKTMLFTVSPGGNAWGGQTQIVAHSLETGERSVLLTGGKAATYVPSGHLVWARSAAAFASGDTLLAATFDTRTNRLAGEPVALGVDAYVGVTNPAVQFSVGGAGTLAFVPGTSESELRLVWVDREGREEPIAAPSRPYAMARVSPDGTRAALDIREDQNDIWTWDFRRETLTRLTFDPQNDYNPTWSPDGRRIAYTSTRGGAPNLFWQSADGVGPVERLTESSAIHNMRSFSPDGTRLLFDSNGTSMLALEGERRVVPLISPGTMAEVSPDGRWMAYQSSETGRNEIYVRPFPDVNSGRWQVSNDGGTRPVWARNGRELFYYIEPGRIMTVPIEPGPTLTLGRPRLLFEGPYAAPIAPRSYDVAPDGRRFLMLKRDESADGTEIKVVLNWIEELKRRVPVD